MENDDDEFFAKVGTGHYFWRCNRYEEEYDENCCAVLTNDSSVRSDRRCEECQRCFIQCDCERRSEFDGLFVICVHSPKIGVFCPRLSRTTP
jgi:hypothetical protein